MLKRRIRQFVAWSAVPPLDAVYRVAYRLAARLAVFILGRQHGIAAIYMTRGCAKNDIVPGVSDIDLIVVTAASGEVKKAAQRTCRLLSRATGGVIEFYPNMVVSRAEMKRRWAAAPAWQHRYLQGRTNWKLMRGEDAVRQLPPLSEAQRKTACYLEINRWWVVFAHQLIATETYQRDTVMRNAACYKSYTELQNLLLALLTGEYRYSRAAALNGDGSPLARRMAGVAARRFARAEPGLAEATYEFLLDFYAQLWATFADQPFLAVWPGMRQQVDCPPGEWALEPREERIADELRHLAETRWRDHYRGSRLVKGASWNLEETLLVIDAAPESPPPLAELVELAALWRRLNGKQPSCLFPVLRIGQAGFPVTPAIPRDLHRGILSPATAPDVFLQLGCSQVYWTDFTEWRLCAWETNEQWLDASPEKRRQLAAITDSAAQHDIIYPLTNAAITRAVERMARTGQWRNTPEGAQV